ncbi:MAG: (2Fe-2S) ferredoxin domain-containing protein [Oscillospiraceae bacterium]|nr:(2Fe-2S) ferredoxin domain-containing protein [Oscillospiraceae bacterium]
MKSLEDLKAIREQMQAKINLRSNDEDNIRVVVGMATCGIAAGARPVLNAIVDEVNKRHLNNVTVTQTGCLGVCRLEPLVEVYVPGQDKVTYVKMNEEKARKIVAEHIVNQQVVDDFTIGAVE